MEVVAEVLDPGFLLRDALLAGLLVGLVCPWVGVYFVLRRIIFLGVALPQVSAAGVALAFLLHDLGLHFLPHALDESWMALVGSLSLTAATLFALALLERGNGSPDGRIGTTYVVAAAASVLLVAADPFGEAHVLALLQGDIVTVQAGTLLAMAVGLGGVALLLAAFHRELLLVSYDPEMATTLGRSVAVWQVVLFAIVGLTISLGVIAVGPTVVFGLLVIPPLAARRLVRGVVPLCALSSAIGVASAFVGFCLAYRLDLPLGPTDVVVAAGALVLTTAARFARDRLVRRDRAGPR